MAIETFNEDHHTVVVEDKVIQICEPFLKRHELAFFAYFKIYRDKKCSILSTHSELERTYLNNQIPLTLPYSATYNTQKKQFYSISSDTKRSEGSKFCNDFFRLDHFIGIIKPYNDYLEVSIFGALDEKYNIFNFYLNNLDVIEKFNLDFKNTAKKLISESDKNKIILSEKSFQPAAELLDIPYKKQKTINNSLDSLTIREIDCIKHIIMGKSMRETAQQLLISPRTVETHIENIKNKLGCNKKSEAISMLLKIDSVRLTLGDNVF